MRRLVNGGNIICYHTQFSTLNPATRSNSRTLFVTKIKPCTFALAAIIISLLPITLPLFSNSARIVPYSFAASISNRHDIQKLSEIMQRYRIFLFLFAFFDTYGQFGIGHSRYTNLRKILSELFQNFRVLILLNIDANIRIEHIFHRISRLVGISASRPFGMKSSVKPLTPFMKISHFSSSEMDLFS